MEIKRIIVYEIPGGRGVNKVLADVVIIFTVGNTISQATKRNCLVEVEDEFIRKDAADWLQEKSVKHAIQYGLRISHYRVSDWVESGFSEEQVSKDKLDHPVFAKMKKFKFED